MNKPLKTLGQFLTDNHISRTTDHYLDKQGRGVRKLRIGRRVFVQDDDGTAWRQMMAAETDAAREAAGLPPVVAHTPQPTPSSAPRPKPQPMKRAPAPKPPTKRKPRGAAAVGATS